MGSPPFSRVAVLGMGVMGGSLARALAALPQPPLRVGWSPDADELEGALADGALDRVAEDIEAAVADAELVVLAAPLSACLDLVPGVVGAMAPGAVLTDVASLKAPMEVAVVRAGAAAHWVGSHPMCGSADSGYAASRADLYRGARVWLTHAAGAETVLPRIARFWLTLGAAPVPTTAAQHDAVMSLASHLPQLTANALALVLEEAGVPPTLLGPGGDDMTRLAGSSPEMWADILVHSSPALPEALRMLARRCEELADLAEARDGGALADRMSRTRVWRRP